MNFGFKQVLFNWDPNDHIPDAHKLFSPNCPLVTGKPVEIPSNIKKKSETAPWDAPAIVQEEKVERWVRFEWMLCILVARSFAHSHFCATMLCRDAAQSIPMTKSPQILQVTVAANFSNFVANLQK